HNKTAKKARATTVRVNRNPGGRKAILTAADSTRSGAESSAARFGRILHTLPHKLCAAPVLHTESRKSRKPARRASRNSTECDFPRATLGLQSSRQPLHTSGCEYNDTGQ